MRHHFLFYILVLLLTISVSAQTKSFHNLSKYEKRWAIWHPFAAMKLKNHQGEMYAIYKEVKQQRLLDTFENGGKLDAFRHTFAMAYFSKFAKAKKLRKLGKAHEKVNYQQFLHHLSDEDGELSDSLSSVMDLKNNDIALSLTKEVKKLSAEDIKQKIIGLIKAGGVFIMKRNAQGLYVDCNNQIIPPEKIKGIWNVPKCLIKSDN
ncbi:MAG TPA: hypothetical protein VNX01_00685 [Bacteroidia bacterium]|nr:hypothetical protein [Bacteroidia bacterium]